MARRSKLWPHKVAITLLYGQFSFLVREQDGLIHCGLGPLAAQLRLRKYELAMHLRELATMGLLTELTVAESYFMCRLSPPNGYEYVLNQGFTTQGGTNG